MATYKSLIDDFDIVQGDSSAIWFIGHPNGIQLDDGNWNGRVIVAEDFGTNLVVDRALPLNSGTGEGDSYTVGTKFVFQLLPAETLSLTANRKYAVTVELSNTTINYNGEIARFKIKVLKGSS